MKPGAKEKDGVGKKGKDDLSSDSSRGLTLLQPPAVAHTMDVVRQILGIVLAQMTAASHTHYKGPVNKNEDSDDVDSASEDNDHSEDYEEEKEEDRGRRRDM